VRSLLARARGVDKRVFDGVLAGVLAVVGVVGTRVSAAESETRPGVLAYVLVLACTLGLLWRRRYPLTVMVVTLGTAVTIAAIGYPDTGIVIAALIAFYSAAAYGQRRRTAIAILTFAAAMAVLWMSRDEANTTAQDLLSNTFVFGAAWAVGEIIRTRRERIATLEERAAVLERERVDESRRAVAEERLRIAQELHDVVAHAMSVITVQAGVGAHVIDTQPADAKRALEAIETTGRSALQELRRMLGVLRSESDPRGELSPAPDVGSVEKLVQSVRDAGVPVELHWEGDPATPVPDSVRLTGYRILQEALTNVVKHAGRARVTVTIRLDPGHASVEVVDDGRGYSASPNGAGSGHGLIGMRERVAVFSGTLVAGPVPGGGFRVLAMLPFEPPAKALPL
jgi:signal transduction histidine kinase